MVTKEKNRTELLKEIRENREKKRQKQLRVKKSRRIIAAVTLALVSVSAFGVVYDTSAKEITITEINEFVGLKESQTVRTRGDNVREALREHGLEISETDKLNVPADKPLNDNDDIVIKRGKRVTIKCGDQESVATVTKADATDALVEAGYAPGAYDSITANGDVIEVVPVSYVDETVTETISRGVEYVDDSDLPRGSEVVIDEGEDGLKEIFHRVTYFNGEERERLLLGENITAEPRSRIVARGTASENDDASDSDHTINGYRYKRKLTMTATAYSTDPSENSGYCTSAMGNALRYGIAAVDPNVIPLGSKIYVTAPDGSWVYGVASAEDTGGAIKGNKIDLCYPENSYSFGRRSCVVYILE